MERFILANLALQGAEGANKVSGISPRSWMRAAKAIFPDCSSTAYHIAK
jgi:hypothetical protein